MKQAILLVSFGTSHKDARENSLDRIFEDIKSANPDMAVYQAYTSGMILKKLRGEGIYIFNVEEAMEQIANDGIKVLYVLPTHIIPGIEYAKMKRMIEPFTEQFEKIHIGTTVLEEQEDCDRMVPVILDMLDFSKDYEYILMGHGSEDEANVRYQQMNDAFFKAGLSHVQIASVEGAPYLEDAINNLKEKKNAKKVMLHPFMVVAGDHAKNDMAGAEDSYHTTLEEEGYTVGTIVKGLGEYPQFRQIYVDKCNKLLGQRG